MSTRILIIEDDPMQQEIISLMLGRRLGYTGLIAADGPEGLARLREDSAIHLVILDIGLPGMSGMDILDIITQRYPGLPVIMLTGNMDISVAVDAMKAGAYDFLTKPVEAERLQVAVRNALKTSLLEKEISRLKRQEDGAFTFDQLIGHDGGLADIISTGRKAAATDIPVLLSGETGTGKEIFARALHGESRRVGKPFVAVNCGAIPAQLVESTLFGHEKGAFTGAIAKSIGRFREAEGGTIFLDEIGDLPPDAQVKLLRVLQQKEVMPVGADKPVPVNVRVISATHRDMATEVAAGRFREDLYFRLNVLPLHLPSLDERPGDIPALARHFIERMAASEARPLKEISPAALDFLAYHSWPGNVRELENTINRAMVLCESDTLTPEDFSALSTSPEIGATDQNDTVRKEIGGVATLPLIDENGILRPLDKLEQEAMAFALAHCHDNVTVASAALGIAKSTFYRKMKENA
ncbi:MAG: sigma-54-dependent Fis family transcriptional regulator [Rhodospirillales bacterium]|nr:sigma-54-dependent Fis family transcriptional regulator [Rhodospirillales bacterium]